MWDAGWGGMNGEAGLCSLVSWTLPTTPPLTPPPTRHQPRWSWMIDTYNYIHLCPGYDMESRQLIYGEISLKDVLLGEAGLGPPTPRQPDLSGRLPGCLHL